MIFGDSPHPPLSSALRSASPLILGETFNKGELTCPAAGRRDESGGRDKSGGRDESSGRDKSGGRDKSRPYGDLFPIVSLTPSF